MIAALAALVAETIVGNGPGGTDVVGRFADDVVTVLAAVLCLLRALDETRGRRAPWLLFSGALTAWSFGTIHQSVVVGQTSPSGATIGELGWLALYPLAGLGFLSLARAQLGRLDARLGIDVLIGACALIAFLAGDLRAHLTSSAPATAAWASVSYTVGDLILVAVAVAIGGATGWRLERLWLVLLAGLMVTVAGDFLYSHDVAMGGVDTPAVIAVVWSVGAALIGLASGIPVPPERPDRRLAGAIGLPIVLAFGALGIVVHSSVAPVDPLSVLFAAASLCAALVRLAVTHNENSVLLEEADERAHVDSLTGLGNRRSLSRDVDVLFASLEPGARLQLTLFDLDGFKAYNDRHGHLAGDELLARLSQRMRAAVAGAGHCYRLGGDEFCLLAPLDEVTATVADEAGPTLPGEAAAALSDPEVTCSFGSVTMARDTPLTDALRAADERMYTDKRARRAADSRLVVPHLDSPGDRRATEHRRAPLSPLAFAEDAAAGAAFRNEAMAGRGVTRPRS